MQSGLAITMLAFSGSTAVLRYNLCTNKQLHARVAQWIERRRPKASVGGSSPSLGAIAGFGMPNPGEAQNIRHWPAILVRFIRAKIGVKEGSYLWKSTFAPMG